jgi:hypothetical protein
MSDMTRLSPCVCGTNRRRRHFDVPTEHSPRGVGMHTHAHNFCEMIQRNVTPTQHAMIAITHFSVSFCTLSPNPNSQLRRVRRRKLPLHELHGQPDLYRRSPLGPPENALAGAFATNRLAAETENACFRTVECWIQMARPPNDQSAWPMITLWE